MFLNYWDVRVFVQMCAYEYWWPWRPEGGIRAPGGVIASEPPEMHAANWMYGPLQKQDGLSSTEPSLQSSNFFFIALIKST